jgi:ABC-type multidrug transport system fused ATPase/permease subunit
LKLKLALPLNNLLFNLKSQPLLFLSFTLTITVSAILESVSISSLYLIVNIILDKETLAEYATIINNNIGVNFNSDDYLLILFAGMAIFFVFAQLFQIMSYFLQYRLSQTLTANWQTTILKRYFSQSYGYFVNHKTGDLIQRQMVHTEQAGSAIVYACQFTRDVFLAILLYVMLWIMSWQVTVFVTIVFFIFAVISLTLAKVKVYTSSQRWAELQKEAYSLSTEVISGIKQVKAFNAENYFLHSFSNMVNERARIYIKNATIGVSPPIVMRGFALTCILAVLYYVVDQRADAAELLPTLVVFVGASIRIVGSLGGINAHFLQISVVLPSLNIVSKILREQPPSIQSRTPVKFKNEIIFKKAIFSHHGEGDYQLSLNGISFKKGKFYGIVGPSGSGKSTIVDLIMGFHHLDDGNLLIDKVKLFKGNLSSFRNKIGWVSQDPFIFSSTIESNISLGVDADKIDFERVVYAAKIADLHNHIMSLPQQYKTPISERGLNISGGQRQRLSIARAVYYDPEIYIFDEATSSLDSTSERKVQNAIEKLSSERKTIIAIAHRFSTLFNADCIYVLRNGEVVDSGTHKQLVNKVNGLYAKLYTEQSSSN